MTKSHSKAQLPPWRDLAQWAYNVAIDRDLRIDRLPGPSPDLPFPNSLFVAVGMNDVGLRPQMSFDMYGVKKKLGTISPRPIVPPLSRPGSAT